MPAGTSVGLLSGAASNGLGIGDGGVLRQVGLGGEWQDPLECQIKKFKLHSGSPGDAEFALAGLDSGMQQIT
jgi:hypothetical protein